MQSRSGVVLGSLMALALAAGCAGPAERKTPPAEAKKPAAAEQAEQRMGAVDRGFLSGALDSGLAEVELGRLAAKKGRSAAVRKFGEQMVRDHSRINDGLREIAEREKAPLPAELSPDRQRIRDTLARLSGRDFDRAYLQNQVEDHRKAIDLYRNQGLASKNERIAGFANQNLPALQQHLADAEGLLAKAKR